MEEPTFTLFPDLPTELRLKIWRLTFLPRFVTIQWDETTNQCISPTNKPLALDMCREARQEALTQYEPFYPASFIYFSFDLDTAYIKWAGLSRDSPEYRAMIRACSRVKSLAMLARHYPIHFNLDVTPVNKFQSLEKIYFVGCPEKVAKRSFRGIKLSNVKLSDKPVPDLEDWLRPKNVPDTRGERVERLPRIECLALGEDCMQHWWLGYWNEHLGCRVPSWRATYAQLWRFAMGGMWQIRARGADEFTILSQMLPEHESMGFDL